MLKPCIDCGALFRGRGSRCAVHRGDTSWGSNRSRATQAAFRRRVLAQAGYRCEALVDGVRCDVTGANRLEAHHTRPGDDSVGSALCKPPPIGRGHHKHFDPRAR